MTRYALTALGEDRPGIVAEVTEVLYKQGCNLEDSAMTRLSGEFAMIVIFSAPQLKTQGVLLKAVNILPSHGINVTLKKINSSLGVKSYKTGKHEGALYLVSVHGVDKPGIVYKMANHLAKLRINITDVTTRRLTDRKHAGYVMLLEINLPKKILPGRLEAQLKKIAKKIGTTATLKPVDIVQM